LKKQLIAEYDVLDILFESQILSPGAKRQMKKLHVSYKKYGGMRKSNLDRGLGKERFWKGIKILLISMLWLIKGGGRSK
jgi:hypothetical protein